MSRYTKQDLRQELTVINNMAKDAGITDELECSSRNGYIGLDVNGNNNIYCGSARECKGKAYQWLAEQLYRKIVK